MKIATPALNKIYNNITKEARDPNVETNASSKAVSALGANTIKYNDETNPVIFKGKQLN